MADFDPVREVIENPIFRVENLLTIVNKEKLRVPFILNRVQRDYFERRMASEKGLAKRKRITGKPRQIGMSVGIEAYNVTEAMLTPNTNVLITCQDDDTKSRFRSLAHDYWESFRAFNLAPAIGADNDYELEFKEIGSRIVFRTATETGGRAYTFNIVHMSEMAFYEQGGKAAAGILPSVPPFGQVDIESTSNGPMGAYYNLAIEAEKGSPEWQWLFYPWWWETSYVADPAIWCTTPLSDREQWLVENEHLTMEQIAYRRAKWYEWDMLGPEAPPVEREFAEDFDTMFSPGDSSVFTAEEMRAIKLMCREPLAREAGISIWRKPMPGEGYVIGADSAAGGAKSDYSSACVLDKNGFQVAGFYDKVDAHTHARVLNDLGHKYNDAYLVPEGWPGEGAITCTVLADSYHYPKLHYTVLAGAARPGFSTTPQTRPELTKGLYDAIRYQQMWINDERLYQELRTLVWYTRQPRPGAKYKLQAALGKNDDYVFAAALGYKHKEFAIGRLPFKADGMGAQYWSGI